jgi:hypothetical protein
MRQAMHGATRTLLLGRGTRGGRRPGDDVTVDALGTEAEDRARAERPLRRVKGAKSFEPGREAR